MLHPVYVNIHGVKKQRLSGILSRIKKSVSVSAYVGLYIGTVYQKIYMLGIADCTSYGLIKIHSLTGELKRISYIYPLPDCKVTVDPYAALLLLIRFTADKEHFGYLISVYIIEFKLFFRSPKPRPAVDGISQLRILYRRQHPHCQKILCRKAFRRCLKIRKVRLNIVSVKRIA